MVPILGDVYLFLLLPGFSLSSSFHSNVTLLGPSHPEHSDGLFDVLV